MSTPLRTGELAVRAGVNIQTLRYYERRGLLAAPARSNGGHRLYPADTVALLAVIKAAQRLGFTLDEVADLNAIRSSLTEVVEARCDSLVNCTCDDCPVPYLALGQTAPGVG